MKHFFALALALAATPVPAQSPLPDPCTAPESRQFDFWIGDWDVFQAEGKLAGTNRIAPLYGCVLHESWKGRGGVEGQSFNRYDKDRGVWHQTWVDSTGGLLVIEGAFQDGSMRLSDAEQPDKKERTSKDGGKTWATEFDGRYVRSGRPQPR